MDNHEEEGGRMEMMANGGGGGDLNVGGYLWTVAGCWVLLPATARGTRLLGIMYGK